MRFPGILLLICLGTGSWPALADDSKGGRLPFQLRVVDDTNSPIADANVRTTGLRRKIGRGTWYAWIPGDHGPVSQVVTDDDGIARGLLDLMMLDRVATADGTNPVSDVMLPIDQQRAAFQTETLEGVIDRGVMVPFVVIDAVWHPVAIVDSVSVAEPV